MKGMVASLIALSLVSSAPKLVELKRELDSLCTAFHGRIGYSVLDIDSGRRIENRADERFPTASTIKTAVALEALREVDAGRLGWSDQRPVPPESGREASMWSYFFKDGTKVDVDGYVNLMLTVSDNTATIVLRQWLTPEAINGTLASLGLNNTKVLWDHFPESDSGDRQLRQTFGLGVTTPHEMSLLWEKLVRRQAGSEAVCEKLLRILSHQYWDDLTGSSVPLGVQTCSKSGAIDGSRSECGLVWAPRPYILTVYTDNQKDLRWTPSNEGQATIRSMCRLIWSAFSGHPYSPPTGYERFLPTGGGGE